MTNEKRYAVTAADWEGASAPEYFKFRHAAEEAAAAAAAEGLDVILTGPGFTRHLPVTPHNAKA